MSDTVLAVDVGTSMVKAVLLGRDGHIVARASAPTPDDGRPGCDAADLWESVAVVLRELTTGTANGTVNRLAGVIVSGQGDGFWSLDVDGSPQRGYPWNTVVASDIIHGWEADGTIEAHFRRTGTVLWPGTNAAIWRWLEATDPDRVGRTGTVFAAKDWISFALTGVAATDVTDGSIAFLDLDGREHSPEVIDTLGCLSVTDRLAPVRNPGDLLGAVTTSASAATGIPEGIPVYVGCLDLIAMIRAAGLREPGDALAVLGTTAVAVSVLDRLPIDQEPSGATVAMPENGRMLRVLGASSGTTTLEWFLRTHGYVGDDRHVRFWDAVGSADDEGVLLLPYLAGERAPFLAPQASGAFLGLTSSTTFGGLGRAVVEGITFSLRHCLDSAGANDEDLVLTGGGSTRAEWCQLVADVLERPVVLEARPDLGALGVASFVPGFEQLARREDPRERVRLTPSAASPDLAVRYRRFLAVVDSIRPLWKELPRS